MSIIDTPAPYVLNVFDDDVFTIGSDDTGAIRVVFGGGQIVQFQPDTPVLLAPCGNREEWRARMDEDGF